jgi:hypothetical protein
VVAPHPINSGWPLLLSPRHQPCLNRSPIVLLACILPILLSFPSPSTCQAQTSTVKPGAAPLPPDSTLTLPAANACQSRYDQFYESEPGVYAYWALCEAGSPIQAYDYVGQFDLTIQNQSFGSGVVSGDASGPVNDGETAASATTASTHLENMGMPVNLHQGTIAAWVKGDATSYTVDPVFFGGIKAQSSIAIGVNVATGFCFQAIYIDSAATRSTIQKCGFVPNSWHRITVTWTSGVLNLFIDGVAAGSTRYTGALDNTLFYYRLFPGCCDTGKPMSIAKASISNQAWTPAQIQADFSPAFPTIPHGGVIVTAQTLGTIHKDILGYADQNQDISTPALKTALLSGLAAAGVTAVRYADGAGGIGADLQNWRGGLTCTKVKLQTQDAKTTATLDTLDAYIPSIAKPLALDIAYTVNYGTNPPKCDAPGDPSENGAALVQYANVSKHYGIKRWEIGNELFSSSSETDFHPQPNTGASYQSFEPAFYTAMKAQDPSIQVGVPIGLADYDWQTNFDLPVLAGARYDAIVWHNYPIKDLITDGATLYNDRVASTTRRTRAALLKLQTELMTNGKSKDAIWITEWNAEQSGNKWSRQTLGAVSPLFVASQLAEYMQAGVQFATWWVQGKPNGCSTMNYDGNAQSAYSWWQCGSTSLVYAGPTLGAGELQVGLKAGDLTPAGRAFQLLSQSGLVTEGEFMLRTQTESAITPWLLTYAATHGSSCAVLLINRDRDNTHIVPVAVAGQTTGTSVKQWTYGKAQYDKTESGDWSQSPVVSIHGGWSNTFQATLPPWSITVLVFTR